MEISRDDIEKITEDIDDSPGGPNRLPGNGNPKTQIKYLQGQLDTCRSLLHNKQEKINELEEALRKTSFQSADQIPVKSPSQRFSRNDIENIMINKSYFVLDLS